MPEVYSSRKKSATTEAVKATPKPQTAKLPASQGGIFSTYLIGPTWVSFDTQEPNEKIILLLRNHWVTNVSWVVIAIAMILAPAFLSSFPILSFLPTRFQLTAVLFWYLLTLAFIFERFLGWFYNIFIVTDMRVVDVDFVNLIYREVSEALLTNIESVTLMQGGIMGALFNFGNVFIQTAAEVENIEFEKVPNPASVVKTINLLT